MSSTKRYNDISYVPSERTALKLSTVLLSLLVLGAVGLLVFFIVKLFKGSKKEDNSTPSPSPTSGGQTPQPPSPSPTSGGQPPRPPPPQPNGGGGVQTNMILFRNGEEITDPNDKCFECKNKINPCACYVNNNCSSSKNNFVPPACNPSQYNCFGYETLNENGGPGVCTQKGINAYTQAANDQRFLNYVCVGRDAAANYNNCMIQCDQGDMGVPPGCGDCCKKGCSNMDCSKSTKGGGGPARTLPPPLPDGGIRCSFCDTICRENSSQSPISCSDCRNICVN